MNSGLIINNHVNAVSVVAPRGKTRTMHARPRSIASRNTQQHGCGLYFFHLLGRVAVRFTCVFIAHDHSSTSYNSDSDPTTSVWPLWPRSLTPADMARSQESWGHCRSRCVMVTHLHCPAHSRFHIRMQRNGEKRNKLWRKEKRNEIKRKAMFIPVSMASSAEILVWTSEPCRRPYEDISFLIRVGGR